MQGITWWHMYKLSCVEELIDNSFPDRLQFQITIVLFLFRRHAMLNDRTTNSNYNIGRQNSFEISLTLLYLNSNVLQMSKIGSFSLCARWLMTLAFMEVSLLTLVCYVTRKLSLERSCWGLVWRCCKSVMQIMLFNQRRTNAAKPVDVMCNVWIKLTKHRLPHGRLNILEDKTHYKRWSPSFFVWRITKTLNTRHVLKWDFV